MTLSQAEWGMAADHMGRLEDSHQGVVLQYQQGSQVVVDSLQGEALLCPWDKLTLQGKCLVDILQEVGRHQQLQELYL